MGLAPTEGVAGVENSVSENSWLELHVERAVKRAKERRAVEITLWSH